MKLGDTQKTEVEKILTKFKVGKDEKRKVIDFLDSKKAFVLITYNTNYDLKEAVKYMEPALRELQDKGYNIKFEIKGLLIKIEYLYQIDDVQFFNPIDSPDLPNHLQNNMQHDLKKKLKLGNLILQRLLLRMDKKHPLIISIGETEFVNQTNSLLLEPLTECTVSDKQYERLVKNSLKRVFNSKNIYEFKTVCKSLVNAANEKKKTDLFNNILLSISMEVSESMPSLSDTEKKNVIWKLKKLMPFIYQKNQDAFIPQLNNIIQKLKNSDSYEVAMDILKETEDSILKSD